MSKAVREAIGVGESNKVIVEVREAFRRHVEELKKIKGRIEPRPGELDGVDLEDAWFDG